MEYNKIHSGDRWNIHANFSNWVRQKNADWKSKKKNYDIEKHEVSKMFPSLFYIENYV